MMTTSFQKIGLFAGPLVSLAILIFVRTEDLSQEATAVMACTAWMAIWWITEAIPIEATALLPIVVLPLTGGLTLQATTAAYGHPLIFLFLGGLIIAAAIERWNLHQRIAINIVSRLGTESKRIILGFMLATALMSMWISNTATALMMLPIGLAVISGVTESHEDTSEGSAAQQKFGKALLLAIAYSASIGGMATLIGTPPNLVLSGMVKELYAIELDFASWMMFGVPVALILLGIAWLYIVHFAFPIADSRLRSTNLILEEKEQLGSMSSAEKRVLGVFVLCAVAWMTRPFVLQKLLPGINDTTIAIACAGLLFIVPAEGTTGERLLNWKTAAKVPWGILLLFGGGLALAAGFRESGLAGWIGDQLTVFAALEYILILFIIVLIVNFLTEVTSNTSTTTILLPVMAGLAGATSTHPYGFMVATALAASCAYMLPVATPPNAVVFGSGHLSIQDMVRAGIFMNFISVVVITLLIYFILPVVWQIDLSQPIP